MFFDVDIKLLAQLPGFGLPGVVRFNYHESRRIEIVIIFGPNLTKADNRIDNQERYFVI